jgi:putative salt-induced outer membrane protein YdiY
MRWVAVFFLMLTASTAHAQIVNVQSILATEASEGLSGSISGSADWRTGNTELLVLSASPVARFRHGDHLIIAIAKGELGRSKGQRIIAKTFEHLRYRYQIVPELLVEVFGQHVYDEFRRLELRTVAGIGPNVALLARDSVRIAFGAAYMFEIERLRTDDSPDAGEESIAHRASTYLMGSYQLDKRLQLIETVYAQPRFGDLADIRLLNESQLVVQLTSKLAVKVSFVLAYDSEPPTEIESLDAATKTTLTLSF